MIHHPRPFLPGQESSSQPLAPQEEPDVLLKESALFQELFWEIFRVLKFDPVDEFAGGVAGQELTWPLSGSKYHCSGTYAAFLNAVDRVFSPLEEPRVISMNDMRNRVRRFTRELNALLKEMATVREEHACELVDEVLTEETMRQFKSSVDAMRRLLWLYIDAAARNSSRSRHPRQAAGLRRATETLRSLHHGAILSPAKPLPGSFIEKVEAIVEQSISSREK